MESLKFGKYEVVEKIGEGGFGEVFQGRDPTLKRFVAIKTCKAASREFLDRFLLEAEISARLQHPNIVTIYDFGYQAETPYLVQEYLAGEDLDRKIRNRAPLDVTARIDILRQAAIGLRHAHHRGIVHRDVKPANVRVLDDGHVKIMDFGIAKLLSSELDLTQTGMTLGTARYQAPEQFQGDKIDLRADIFSFGVTAYELLTFERPFDGDSVGRIFYRITHEDPRPLLELWPECPENLQRCIENCLRKDPAHRYSDLAPVIGVLEAYCAPVGSGSYPMAIPAADPGPLPPPPPPPPPSSAVSATAGTFATPSKRSRTGLVVALAAVTLAAFGLTYAAGKLWQGGERFAERDVDGGESPPPVTLPEDDPPSGKPPPEETAPSEQPAGGLVITEPAAAGRTLIGARSPAEPAVRGAVVYLYGDFQGRSETFSGDDPDLADNLIGDDAASSVRVAPGCRVLLFRNSGYQGRETLLTADAASLGDTEVGDGEASSIQVRCPPRPR